MTEPSLKINLNFPAIWSKYFVKLQHLLDGISLLEAGVSVVTEEQIAERRGFMSCYPAADAQLPFNASAEYAQEWLSRAFLRDAIEITGLFLDDCLSVCALVDLATKKKTNNEEIHRVLNVLPLRHHKLHFPEKVAKLEREFGIRSECAPHILSINRARTCVVHRLGTVSRLDVGESNELIVTWRSTETVAREIETGVEHLLDRPTLIERESMLQVRFIDYERRFGLGEQIKLSPYDIYSCIITCWAFGISTTQAVEGYARSAGLGDDATKPAV